MASSGLPTASGGALAAPQKNWFERNWKWFVPVLVVSSALLVAAFVAIIFFSIQSMFRGSHPYQVAIERMNHSAAVDEAIGKPIKVGWSFAGSVEYRDTEGSANFSFPISGPKGSGRVFVVAKRENGQWTFQELEVRVKGEAEPIPLLDPIPGVDSRNGSGTA